MPRAERTRAGSWIGWPLVALSALPVVGIALVARRVLTGRTELFGEVPGDLPFRERAGLLLNVGAPESQLVVPLLGLGVLLLLAHRTSARPPRAALWAGAGVAAAAGLLALAQAALVGYLVLEDPTTPDQGFSFGQQSLLELFGPRAVTAVLLAALSGGLAVALITAVRRSDAAEPELLDDEPLPPAEEPAAALEPVVELEVVATRDPHARFRRPS